MRPILALLALVLTTGCVDVAGFDPTGSQAAITGAWQIDGLTPTNTLCEALGASRVRTTFLDDRRPIPHPGLFFQCRTGTFDTRGAGGAVVGAGRWTVRLDAIDGSGDVVAAGTATDVTIEQGEYDSDAGVPLIVVETANFFSATLSTAFRVGGQDADAEACESAGIATVGLVFDDLGGGAVTNVEPELCALGVVGTRILPGHTYVVRLRALDAAGGAVVETPAQTFAVSTGARIELDAGGAIDLRP